MIASDVKWQNEGLEKSGGTSADAALVAGRGDACVRPNSAAEFGTTILVLRQLTVLCTHVLVMPCLQIREKELPDPAQVVLAHRRPLWIARLQSDPFGMSIAGERP